MSRRNGITVTGIGKLSVALERVSDGLEVGGQAGTDRTADEVLQMAQGLVPVDSGELLESGRVERDGDDVEIVFDAPHAGYVEFGTADTPPQPFMTPAGELARVELPRQVAAEVRKRVR